MPRRVVAAVGVAERSAPAQFGDQAVGDLAAGRAAAWRVAAGIPPHPPRATPAADRPGLRGVPTKTSASLAIFALRQRRRAALASRAAAAAVSSRNTTRSANTRTGAAPSARCDAIASTMAVVSAALCGVTNPTSALRRDQAVGGLSVAERGDDRLSLRRPRRDGRALDGEPRAVEVDVVQLVSVDEPARWRRRGSRRRPPSCPTVGAAPRRSRRPRRAEPLPSLSGPRARGDRSGLPHRGSPTPAPGHRPDRS